MSKLTAIEGLYYDMLSFIPEEHRQLAKDLLDQYKQRELEQHTADFIAGYRHAFESTLNHKVIDEYIEKTYKS